MPIRTKRLVLREFQVDDWQSVHEYASDEDVIRYVEWGPNSEADSKNFVEKFVRGVWRDTDIYAVIESDLPD